MNRDILYRFFEGTATLEEEMQIRQWMNLSDANAQFFKQERATYDALLLTSQKFSHQNRNKRMHWLLGSVAAVMLLLIINGLYFLSETGPTEYNTIIVPPGQRMNVILADNSNIWLNANSTFRYPTRFSQKTRMVYLDGEGYFNVSENKKKPFIVKTNLGDIKVTGTSFNVEAYTRFNKFETSLFEGGVEIYKNNTKLTSLSPNEIATIRGNNFTIDKIKDNDKYLWKNGLIAFNNKRLEEILSSLEKYFDVKIQIHSTSLPKHTYTGKFRQSDGIDYALRVLQKSIRFNFDRNEKSGTIYIN